MMRKQSECINKTCTSIVPNSKDIFICKNDCEKQVNICVDKIRTVIIWGYIQDHSGKPIEGAIVKLFEFKNQKELKSICHTFTDTEGYYQFDLRDDCDGKYRILVSKCSPHKEKSKGKAYRDCNSDYSICYDCLDDDPCDSLYNQFDEEYEYSSCYTEENKKKNCNKINYNYC